MKNNLKNKKGFTRTPKFGVTPNGGGFTLIETLVGMSIFVLIVFVLTLFSKNIWSYNSFVSGELENINMARTALKTMVAEIRTASSGSNGAYAVGQATSTSFTFYSDIYDNGLKERIRYFLNGTNLQKGITKPTGSPLSYTEAETVTTLISNVTSSSIFEYYDKNYDGTTAALSSPVDISILRLIKITVTIDKNSNKPPAPITISTMVSMRNIKDNL